MRRHSNNYFFTLCALAALLLSSAIASFVTAQAHRQNAIRAGMTSAAKPATASLLAMHVVNMQTVPIEKAGAIKQRSQSLPLLTGHNAATYAQRKAAASHNQNVPFGQHGYANPTNHAANTPPARKAFAGMADSGSICYYFGGCQPPDMALATSSKWVFQGVNMSFAVYNKTGAIQSGWPKNAQNFFGVPNPPGGCDSRGPFMSDPRAFYDINDGRFWAAMLQVEGAFGVGGNCPFQSVYWIAVSQTGNPNGTWNIYAYDMALGTQYAADYTQFGFDQQAIYFSGNMFDVSGNIFQYQEIFGVNKANLEKHISSQAFGFTHLTITGNTAVLVDTVQPVEVEAHTYGGPDAGLFISSFNINGDPSGDNCASTPCHGLAVWALANPGTQSTSLSSIVVDTNPYMLAPNADQPSCNQCVETLDTRVTGTPPYHNGLISFALETAINNGTQVVPAIFWGQVAPQLNAAGVITGASLFQQGNFYSSSGDTAVSFGALMPDADGDLFMVFEMMGNTVNPEVAYTARRVYFTLGQFPDGGLVLRQGDAPTGDFRWGDYEATSYSGFSSDTVWFAGEYSNGDWATYIGSAKF